MSLTPQQYKSSEQRLLTFLQGRFGSELNSPEWEFFILRLKQNLPELLDRMLNLYGAGFDFYYHFERLVEMLASSWLNRGDELKALDAMRASDTEWFQSSRLIGGCAYVDLFANDLEGMRQKIHYLNELGITYLHLMPPYLTPKGDDDGGYAVSSYRELNEKLGSIEDLERLASELRQQGISLALDFVFNHTADDHKWAKRALEGDPKYQEFYLFFDTADEKDAYEKHLRAIFPNERLGNFTYITRLKKWVWTTFHSYQWDLNYKNPEVLRSMAEEMLFLANLGVEILRMDAVPFLWKQQGTNCENLPEAHEVIQLLKLITKIAAPSMIFKSEAIVAPDEIKKYMSPNECQISYNPMLMSQLWEALATKKVNLLHHALHKRFQIHPQTAWVNYVRSHDDIGWGFDDQDASEIGIDSYSHRQFLTQFYTGVFESSFSQGVAFQQNPLTGDARVCGTTASLCGLNAGADSVMQPNDELAIKRINLLYGVTFTIGGIPLLYLGDEIGMTNDLTYVEDADKIDDERWIHRPYFNWERADLRRSPSHPVAQLFRRIVKLSQLRSHTTAIEKGDTDFFWTNNSHVLGYFRSSADQTIICLANFNEYAESLDIAYLRQHGLKKNYTDLISGKSISLTKSLIVEPLELLVLMPLE